MRPADHRLGARRTAPDKKFQALRIMRISFIGSGNAATHLAALLLKEGHTIETIYSPHPKHAQRLAKKVKAKAVSSVSGLHLADCLILAVKDDRLAEVIKEIPPASCLVLHTSGSEPLSLLKKKFKNCGVLYPVQTFSIHSPVPEKIPFCIEASNPSSLRKIKKLAHSLSGQVWMMTSRERKAVHLAAVFANNFSNHLFAIAERIVKKYNISFDILKPLIEETVSKINRQSPSEIQTGPAARGDRLTMKAHLALLAGDPESRALYRLFSASIGSEVHDKK